MTRWITAARNIVRRAAEALWYPIEHAPRIMNRIAHTFDRKGRR